MTETLPPVRTTHVFRAPGRAVPKPMPGPADGTENPGPSGSWCYDFWGLNGRPVVFLPAVLFGRASWWPVAADLRPHATVVAVDLPGHGSSGRRVRYQPEELVDDLAHLVDSLQTRRAPVVVGHGASAVLADLFAARYATHAVVTVDPWPAAGLDAYLEAMDVDAIPGQYRHVVEAARDPDLLAAYATVLRDLRPATATMGVHPARLAVYSRRADVPATERLWRHEVYDVPGRFAHLAAVQRFVADIKGLL